jgi:hypothetical protein
MNPPSSPWFLEGCVIRVFATVAEDAEVFFDGDEETPQASIDSPMYIARPSYLGPLATLIRAVIRAVNSAALRNMDDADTRRIGCAAPCIRGMPC